LGGPPGRDRPAPSGFSEPERSIHRLVVDALDFAIYRYLSPDGQIRFWGGRRLVDPRMSAREIADRVGLSETGVRARLRTLEKRGYLSGRETGVNPGLFGVSLAVSEIPVREPHDAERLLRELALVEGVTFARDTLDESERMIRVYHVSDSPAATARRTALLRRLAPTSQVRGPRPYWIPECDRELSPLDWRMLVAFRTHPQASFSELANHMGVSLKTTANRLHRLLDAKACWSGLSSSCEEFPLAMISVSTRDDVNPLAVAESVVKLHPTWIPVAPDGAGDPPTETSRAFSGLVAAEAPASLERVLRQTLALDGVTEVRRTFALGSASYPQWFDERLSTRAKSAK
jgi:DNA-binding Lrp family transcriptional regulator